MTPVATLSRFLLLLIVRVSVKDVTVSALAIVAPHKVIAINGGVATFKISYVLGSFEIFTRLRLKKNGTSVFEAPFYLPPDPPYSDGGFYGVYASRGSTDYSHGKTNFTISLSQVKPDDEGHYIVEVSIIGGVTKSSVVLLVVDLLPGTPSLTGAPSQPVVGGAGPTVLTCTANLGKPQASMAWWLRTGNAAYINVTENATFTSTNNTDGTTNGTSTLTVSLDTADDGVQFRCHVSNRQASLSGNTQIIKVTAPEPVADVNIRVCKTSTTLCALQFDYFVGDQIGLTCGVNPSSPPIPAPHAYVWYQFTDINGAILSKKVLEDEIVYICNASNIVRGVTYTASKQITIKVTVPIQEQGLADGEIAGVVVSVCAVAIVLLVLFLVIRKRRVMSVIGFRGNKVSRPSANRQTQLSSYQTRGTSMRAGDVTYTDDLVNMELTNTCASCRKLTDVNVENLVESLGLHVHSPAVETGQVTTNCLRKLSIEDLASRLVGVPLGSSRIILEKVRKTGEYEQIDDDQTQDDTYSDIQASASQQTEDVPYVNVTQPSVYEELANSAEDSHEEYSELHGPSVEDNTSEYEIMT